MIQQNVPSVMRVTLITETQLDVLTTQTHVLQVTSMMVLEQNVSMIQTIVFQTGSAMELSQAQILSAFLIQQIVQLTL